MNDRRSMSQALRMTPTEMDFIKNGPPKTVQPKVVTPPSQSHENIEPQFEQVPVMVSEPDASPENDAHHERKVRPRKEKVGQAKNDELTRLTTPVVPITIRFRQSTAEALRRASLERRLSGMSPATQQEIVEAAVSDWLRDNT